MSASATACYGKPVLTGDEKTLGVFVNIVMNKNSAEAAMVVFPGLRAEWKVDKASTIARAAGGILSTVAGRFLPDYTSQLILSEVRYSITDEVAKRATRKTMDISSTYYFIPVANIESSEGDTIRLNLSFDECATWYRNVAPSPEAEMAFFDHTFYTGPPRSVLISLNLRSLRGALIEDSTGRNARVQDIRFDPQSGVSSGLECIIMGRRAERKIVDVKCLKFEYNKIISTAALDQYPSAQ